MDASNTGRRKLISSLRKILCILFLSAQLVAIVYGQMGQARYFCWAPYDSISFFRITVIINGRSLSQYEIKQRYRLRNIEVETRSIQHVIDILQQYEETYGKEDAAEVHLIYNTNGGEEKSWQ